MSYLGQQPDTALSTTTMSPGGSGLRVPPAMLVWGVAGLAALAGLMVGRLATTPVMDAELVPLLRFMAVIKAGMAVGATALAQWRLRREAGTALTAALVGSSALMMVAPGLIWGLSHLVAGAVLFHAGLLVFLVAAARDGLGLRFPGLRGP